MNHEEPANADAQQPTSEWVCAKTRNGPCYISARVVDETVESVGDKAFLLPLSARSPVSWLTERVLGHRRLWIFETGWATQRGENVPKQLTPWQGEVVVERYGDKLRLLRVRLTPPHWMNLGLWPPARRTIATASLPDEPVANSILAALERWRRENLGRLNPNALDPRWCVECGYDRFGLPALGTCPECGWRPDGESTHVFARGDLVTIGGQDLRPRSAQLMSLGFVVACVALLWFAGDIAELVGIPRSAIVLAGIFIAIVAGRLVGRLFAEEDPTPGQLLPVLTIRPTGDATVKFPRLSPRKFSARQVRTWRLREPVSGLHCVQSFRPWWRRFGAEFSFYFEAPPETAERIGAALNRTDG